MHEAILGTPIPLSIHNATTYDVTHSWPNSAGSTILYEYHNGTGTLSPTNYADVAVYRAFEQDRQGNHTGALQTLQILNKMWDTNGLVDDAFRTGGEQGAYQTFKDVLYLLALLKTGQPMPANLEEKILDMQGADGGFNTGYFPNGTYAGRYENTETTSIAMLALEALFPEPLRETWYLFLIPIAALPIMLDLLIYYPSRKKRGLPSRPTTSPDPSLAKVE